MKPETTNLLLKDVFTISQVVEKSGIPKRTIYNRIERGAITPLKFGGRFLLDKKTVERLRHEYSPI